MGMVDGCVAGGNAEFRTLDAIDTFFGESEEDRREREANEYAERGAFESEVTFYVSNDDYDSLDKIRDLTGFEIFNLLEYVNTKNMLYYLLSRDIELFNEVRPQNEDIEKEVKHIRKDCVRLTNLISGKVGVISKVWNFFRRKNDFDLIEKIINRNDSSLCIMALNAGGQTLSDVFFERKMFVPNSIHEKIENVKEEKRKLENSRKKNSFLSRKEIAKKRFLDLVSKPRASLSEIESMLNENPFLLTESLDKDGLTCSKIIEQAPRGNDFNVWNFLTDKLIELDYNNSELNDFKSVDKANAGSALIKKGGRASGQRVSFDEGAIERFNLEVGEWLRQNNKHAKIDKVALRGSGRVDDGCYSI